MTSMPASRTADLVSRYMVLTKEVMPQMARDPVVKWPVRNDHCFQGIIIDIVCDERWFANLSRPAYKSLSHDQAVRAVQLCEDIIVNFVDLYDLNRI